MTQEKLVENFGECLTSLGLVLAAIGSEQFPKVVRIASENFCRIERECEASFGDAMMQAEFADLVRFRKKLEAILAE